MDYKTAKIIKEQIMGQYAGHMANIPHNPVLHSMFTVLIGKGYDPADKDKEKAFAKVLREIADALTKETKNDE